jgi:hypothetical protein
MLLIKFSFSNSLFFQGFQESTSARTALAVRNEIDKLISTIKDEKEKKAFASEMYNFHELFARYARNQGTSGNEY